MSKTQTSIDLPLTITSSVSVTGPVDTELPSAAALADNTANPTVPGVGAFMMAWDSIGTNWDRASAITLVDADTGAGTVLIPQVNIVARGIGGPNEIFISTNPAFVQLRNTATYSDGVTGSDWGPVCSFPWIYNVLTGTWNRQLQAQLVYSSAGLSQVGLPIHALAGYYNSNPAADPCASNYYHRLQCSLYQALHVNRRDGLTGTELLESAEATLLASAARTTTQTGADIVNYSGAKYLHVTLDMTVVTASPDVTLTIQGKDPASGKYYTILAGTNITTISTNVYRVGPGLPVTANVSISDFLPRIWRIIVTANNANAGTYSVGYSVVK